MFCQGVRLHNSNLVCSVWQPANSSPFSQRALVNNFCYKFKYITTLIIIQVKWNRKMLRSINRNTRWILFVSMAITLKWIYLCIGFSSVYSVNYYYTDQFSRDKRTSKTQVRNFSLVSICVIYSRVSRCMTNFVGIYSIGGACIMHCVTTCKRWINGVSAVHTFNVNFYFVMQRSVELNHFF